MRHISLLLTGFLLAAGSTVQACETCSAYDREGDFAIASASGRYNADLDSIVLSIVVKGRAGRSTPKPAGKLDGAPVLAYVFPTTLKSADVGFNETEGIVALALTSHPDFDDSRHWLLANAPRLYAFCTALFCQLRATPQQAKGACDTRGYMW